MKELLPTVFDTSLPEYRLKNVFPKEDELPDVSIVTLTKDRRNFMPLAKYCYLLQTYPEDKMEWVIVDDGEDSIEDTLIGVPNVTYVRCEPGMTIGQKRNLGVSKALYDTIVMCDDDDVYPENTVLHRVAMMMKEPVKECGFCTTIPCYDITKYSSFMNVPPMTLPMSQRVSEATLIFTRKFWEDRKFDETSNIAEGDAFIRGREQMCRELSPQEVIVSLTHPKNLSSRKIPDFKEPNGCHYGFNEKLFALVSEIGIAMEQSNTSGQTGSDGTCETSSSCENGGDAHP
jgi:glycosyltransferase involved in cell wall biosynthesis